MGLDSYIYSTNKENISKSENGDVRIKGDLEVEELQYWRKHYKMHNFFENVWKESVSDVTEENDFNCEFVLVTPKVLSALKEHVKSYQDVDVKKEDLSFIKSANSYLRKNKGKALLYYSWW